jgi:cytidylate kinase
VIVAIDGPAGSGKSAVAAMIAEQWGFFLLNSGLFYRAITWALLTQGVKLEETEATSLTKRVDITLQNGHLFLNGEDVSAFLHSDEVDKAVASVSSFALVRQEINRKIALLCVNLDVVCEGRDIGTVVFPHAEVKIYLDASAQARSKRRFNQGYSEMSLDEITKSIQNRDEIDKNKAIGALKIALGALYIDSSDMTLLDVYQRIIDKMEEVRK